MKRRLILFTAGIFIIFLPIFVIAQAGSATLYYGIRHYQKGNFEKAIKKFENVTNNVHNLDDETSEIIYWCAKAKYLQNSSSINEYRALIDKAILINPKNTDAIYFKAQILKMQEGLSTNSIEYFRKILEYENIETYVRNISAFYTMGYDKTRVEYIDSEFENEAGYFYSIAVIMSNLNKGNEAKKNLEKALSMGFSNYDYLKIDFRSFTFDTSFYSILNYYRVPAPFFVDAAKTEMSYMPKTIKTYVENKINIWQKKGKFEKTADYLQRVTPDTRITKVDYYTQAAIDSIGSSYLRWDDLVNEYDADNESFKLVFLGFDPVIINVPISEAPSFDSHFNELEFSNVKFTLSGGVKPYILHMDISNPDNGQVYIYDSQDEIAFKSTQLNFNFEEIDLVINDLSQNNTKQKALSSTTIIAVGKSDVDTNIPVTGKDNKNTYALIIGNEDYTKYQNDLNSEVNVDYAKRDGEVFAQYAEKTLVSYF